MWEYSIVETILFVLVGISFPIVLGAVISECKGGLK